MSNKKYTGIRDPDEAGGDSLKMSHTTKVKGHTYILLSIAGSLFNAFGQIIRGYESGRSVIASNFIFGTAWLLMPIIYILVMKYHSRGKGETWVMPWFNHSESGMQIFRPKILLFLILGGILEFAGCQMMMISFNLG
jgi:hypothetical protein